MPKQLSFCLHLFISKRRNCTTPPVWREFGKRSKKSLDQSKQILLQIQIMSGLQIQTNDMEGGVVVVQFCLQYSIPVIKSNKSCDIYIRNRTYAWDIFLFPSLTSWNPQECWILLPPPPHKGIDHSQNWQGSSLQLSMFFCFDSTHLLCIYI